MAGECSKDLFCGLDRVSDARLDLIRKVFRTLPKTDRPRILDVGCGRGGPTLELARLSGGDVIGIDIDTQALKELEIRAKEEDLSEHIRIMNCSMLNVDFEDDSIDIIWSEGSIDIVGFEKGLDTWRRLLAEDGYLVIHLMAWLHPDPPSEITDHWHKAYPGIRTVPEYLDEIPRHGYTPTAHLTVPQDFWWIDYYQPLENRLIECREKYSGDLEALKILESQQREVDLYKKYSHWYGSAYLVMQKTATDEARA